MPLHGVLLWIIRASVASLLLFGPAPAYAHCACQGIVGAIHCQVYHAGNCAQQDQERESPREELDEPEPKVIALRFLGENGQIIGSIPTGDDFLVEAQFDREPEFQRTAVAIEAILPDGSKREIRPLTIVKQRRGTIFRSLPVRVTWPSADESR
jgi:hypothetical protein